MNMFFMNIICFLSNQNPWHRSIFPNNLARGVLSMETAIIGVNGPNMDQENQI